MALAGVVQRCGIGEEADVRKEEEEEDGEGLRRATTTPSSGGAVVGRASDSSHGLDQYTEVIFFVHIERERERERELVTRQDNT